MKEIVFHYLSTYYRISDIKFYPVPSFPKAHKTYSIIYKIKNTSVFYMEIITDIYMVFGIDTPESAKLFNSWVDSEVEKEYDINNVA